MEDMCSWCDESTAAFKRFGIWLKEREIPDIRDLFMYMGKKEGVMMFKNINTRNYLMVNEVPSPFNL